MNPPTINECRCSVHNTTSQDGCARCRAARTWEAAQNKADAVRAMLDKRDDERAETERQIRECVVELRAAGMPIGAIADELDRLGHRTLEADPVEAEIVAAVVKARAAGLSIREIAAELAAAGMRSKDRDPK